jgi:hypothetical protein
MGNTTDDREAAMMLARQNIAAHTTGASAAAKTDIHYRTNTKTSLADLTGTDKKRVQGNIFF